MRITAAVYEALRPILNEMREDIISSVKSEMATISQSVGNQTEEVNTRLGGLNQSLRDDFSGVEDMICDKIEEHDCEGSREGFARIAATIDMESFLKMSLFFTHSHTHRCDNRHGELSQDVIILHTQSFR